MELLKDFALFVLVLCLSFSTLGLCFAFIVSLFALVQGESSFWVVFWYFWGMSVIGFLALLAYGLMDDY
jgi:RsiW-degrading membrane proteinase PrsW (M82 family)